jgi:two-component system, cell cycle sensor histidine kinase and response regulator CckA
MVSPSMKEALHKVVASGDDITKKVDLGETTLNVHDKEVLPVNISILPLSSNSFLCFIYNCRERKRMELHEVELEFRLRQTQKLDAISRLAGGIAHDFNNLLTAIIGNIDLAKTDLDPDHRVHELLSDIRIAADRATDLTSQLLAFSRKQTIQPVKMDLADFMQRKHDLFLKTVGENITLSADYPKKECFIHADEGQMEQVLLILLVNSSEAISGGGEIRMSVSCAHRVPHTEHGEDSSQEKKWFIRLKIWDNGEGMNDETRMKIFEPFFTTKSEHVGSGLGLPTVYGIVKQHGGFVEVSSKIGEGTEFRLYLPRYETGKKCRARKKTKEGKKNLGGGETILFVEDDPIVLKIGSKSLEKHGYTLMCAVDGVDALRVLGKTKTEPDLLLTDIVMPNMNGAELAKRLSKIRPDLKILFTSGYAEEIIARHGIVDSNVNFIGKPYSPASLCGRVREVLDTEKHMD